MKYTKLGVELPAQPDHRRNTINKTARTGTHAREHLPFTAWELEIMAGALLYYTEQPRDWNPVTREQVRRLADRLQRADPILGGNT